MPATLSSGSASTEAGGGGVTPDKFDWSQSKLNQNFNQIEAAITPCCIFPNTCISLRIPGRAPRGATDSLFGRLLALLP